MSVGERKFDWVFRVFKYLSVNEGTQDFQITQPHQYYTTEKALLEKLPKLFGYRCDTWAKLMYVRMSGGKDHAKIHFPQFVQAFEGLMDP